MPGKPGLPGNRIGGWVASLAGTALLAGCGLTPVAPAGSTAASLTPVASANSASFLVNIHMFTTGQGVGIGPRGVYATTDGAKTWVPVAPPGVAITAATTAALAPGETASGWTAVGLTPDGTAWIVNQAPAHHQLAVYWTANRGQTWSGGVFATSLFSQGGGVWVRSLSFLGKETAFITVQPQHGMSSEPGELWVTRTGGTSWTRIAATNHLTWPAAGQVGFLNRTTGWDVASLTTTTPNVMWETTDGGATWTPVSLPGHPAVRLSVLTPPQFFGAKGILPVEYVPQSARTVAFSTILYHSADGGRTWHAGAPVRPSPPGTRVDIISPTTAWLATGYQFNSYSGYPVTGGLYLTVNGGVSWIRRPASPLLKGLMAKGYAIRQLDFLDLQQGWATTAKLDSTQSGPLLQTQNGGRSWQIVKSVVRRPPKGQSEDA
ncbi:MAG: hypothetical protein M0Z53_06560 [Thermaerobacter sp.]|nr:hypothetical protein [Thermaerobacter sp.]